MNSDEENLPDLPNDYHYNERSSLRRESCLTDFWFKRIFRMTRTTFQDWLEHEEVGSDFPIGRSNNGHSFNPRQRLMHFSKWLGANDRYVDNYVSTFNQRKSVPIQT